LGSQEGLALADEAHQLANQYSFTSLANQIARKLNSLHQTTLE